MTSTNSAFAVFDVSYAARTPLITAQEYSNAPTAMDVANLIAGGNPQANLDALTETIGRASSWCDQFCFGAYGCIAATSQVENARSWGTYRNTISIHTKYWPVLQVDTFSYSAIPGGLTLTGSAAASIDPANNITIYPQSFEVSLQSAVPFGLNGATGIIRGIEYDTQYIYTAGWPQTTLAEAVTAGATSIVPLNVTGMYPGTMLTLYDMPNDEAIQISSSYVAGASVVPFANPLQYNHTTAATLTNLPPAIKQAAILVTTAFIKERGSGALVVSDMGAQTHQESGFNQNSGGDWEQAKMLLRPFRQMYVGW